MLKEEKNEEFRDQIYYALANIYFKEGDVEEAIKHYRLSSESSVSNAQQKTTSCLKLADIYYDRNQYMLAEAYYDSATISLSADYPGYQDIMTKSKSLSGLIENLNIIQFEDSVQRLAAMDEDDRIAVIDTIIAKLREKEQLAKEMELRQMSDQQFNRVMLSESNRAGGFGQSAQGGTWYFYNQAAKSFGQPEFKMKWGNRKLEDNWRRANKTEISFGEMGAEGADSAIQNLAVKKILDNKTREFYLQDIPLNDSMLELSHNRLMKAYFNAGVIYKTELKDYKQSNGQFEQLLENYPGNEYTLQAYYNLHLNYSSLDDQQSSQFYKESIIREFPESQIAQLMTNPGYIKELEEKENEEMHYYEQVYEKYKNGRYREVITDVDTALMRYNDSPLKPKYMFLKVLSVGATRDLLTFTLALDTLAKIFPQDEVGVNARSILAFIKEYDPEVKEETEKIEAEEIYLYDTSAVHFFGMIVPGTVDVNQLKFEIINFNLDFYPEMSYDVVNEQVNKSDQLVLVRSFANPDSARSYQQQISLYADVNRLIEGSGFQQFIISEINSKTLIKDKITSKYLLFYKKYYTGN
jgi:tetratricopeptide (TPR) repeat protein